MTSIVFEPPRMTRAELEAAALGRPGAPADAPLILDAIEGAWWSVDAIEKRRKADGSLSAADRIPLDAHMQLLAGWYRELGLYPVVAEETR